jgi:glycosyltransferase involved in cell wall biosynthesis
MQPDVTVVTTAFNYARYLPELAKSIERQSLKVQWVVVDDASKDDPQSAVCNTRISQLDFIRLTTNHGYSYAKNVGICAAKANFIAMIDADDMLTDDSLAVRFNVLRNSNKLWVHGEALCIDESCSDKPNTRYRKINEQRRHELEAQGVDLTKTYHHRLVHAQTVMVKREFHERLGLYDESLRFSSDNEMWRRAIRFGVLPEYIDFDVAIYRVHLGRMCQSAYKKSRAAVVKQYIINVVEQRYREGINSSNTPVLEKRS